MSSRRPGAVFVWSVHVRFYSEGARLGRRESGTYLGNGEWSKTGDAGTIDVKIHLSHLPHAWADLAPVEIAIVTKKEIVKKISEDIGLTQLKTKDIVQRTLDAIIQTLVSEGRIELRNFGVFEVKRRAPRKARNPRTGDKVYVPSKNVVTFKPGKEMEELVRKMNPENLPLLEDESDADVDNNGPVEPVAEPHAQSSAEWTGAAESLRPAGDRP